MMRIALLTISLFALLACQDEQRLAEQKAQTERVAKLKVENAAERALMTSSDAVPELRKRLSNWLTVSDGVATFSGESSYSEVHAMPAPKSWLVSCGTGGIVVEITMPSDRRYATELTRARLTHGECRPLAAAVGKQMQELLGKL
jgi:hypothetical protein